jgi:GDP-4-dehydro-6-deoxy-D-mannose reductase
MPIWKGFVKRKNKALITGIGGFAGSFLTELLVSKGFRVFGFLAPGEKTENIRHIIDGISLERFDILKENRVARFISKVKPDYIFHLAAFSSVGRSFASERMTLEINFFGSLYIFKAAAELKPGLKKLVYVSSADAYGAFKPEGKTLNENQSLNPISPYGISKAAAEYVAQYYYKNHSLPVVIARSFNHTGPRQSENFVVPSFCKQIASIEINLAEPRISVGNLSARRDLSDVRDITTGYYLLAARAKPGEVIQLCSGRSVAIKTILDKLLRMSTAGIKVTVDKRRFRKVDIPVLKGDNTRAVGTIGWRPKYRLNDTLKDTLQYWREKTKK